MLTTPVRLDSRTRFFDPIERQRVVGEHLLEVRYIARRIHARLPLHVSFDDLVHAGILGLLDAVDKFDPRKNVPLKSYARFRIRGAILDSLRQMDWIPRSLRRQARRFEDAKREFAAEWARAPSQLELAQRLGLDLQVFQRLLGDLWGLGLGSLWSRTEDGGADATSTAVASRPEEDPFQLTLRTEMRTLLAETIGELNDRERQVLRLYYLEELTMKQVGAIVGVVESRVSHIHTAALIRLRSRLQGRVGSSAGSGPGTVGTPAMRERCSAISAVRQAQKSTQPEPLAQIQCIVRKAALP